MPGQTTSAEVDPLWWRSFNDTKLSSLVDRLAAQNLDLQAAAERVLQGRAQRRVAASQGLPQINEESSYRRERLSTTGAFSLFQLRPGVPSEIDVFQNGLNASWELDLFGRVRRAVEAALINAIGFLLAAQPRALEAELSPRAALPGVPSLVPIGLPGALVRRRPDVQEPEARLHAATAETGVAVANFYPDISLTGMTNLNGLRLANAFSLPSREFNVGPVISIPICRGGQLTGELRLRESQQREAAIAFQRTVLQAWQEVDNALTSYAETQSRRRDVAEAVTQNEAALRAARQRYQEGAADFLNVVSSQSQLLQSQQDLAVTDTEIRMALVTLCRALGGGREISEQPAAANGSSGRAPRARE